jgi:hypothetical protein
LNGENLKPDVNLDAYTSIYWYPIYSGNGTQHPAGTFPARDLSSDQATAEWRVAEQHSHG